MAKVQWYVAQVQTGKESFTCRAIERACKDCCIAGEPLVSECFSPTFIHRLKYGSEWRDIEKPLLPGYVVAVTAYPEELAQKLRKVPDFTKLLTMAETFVPLREDERAWIDGFTEPRERVVPVSIGHRVGDIVVITEGPLKGREAMITQVIRKKCLAVLELHVGGKSVMTTVGLALLPNG